jgi:2-succinyl-5-enolpyruvyl-6-hydroxy-3-cyclohexene-1-carboxylate synthase
MSNMPLAPFNVSRAQLLIDTLYQQGIQHFCIAPGSRSTPLSLAIAEHSKVVALTHFDERGLGFYALGIAKATSKPVALLVTSGTAVANLLPAIMEAHLSRVPLLILSADRPPELRDCGANQTADQVKIFSNFTRWQVDLAFSDPLASDEYMLSTIAYAVDRCSSVPPGPVQVNCMIREPFIHFDSLAPSSYKSCFYESTNQVPLQKSFKDWGNLLSNLEKGVIILGSDALKSADLESFLLLAETLNWPIFSDVISGGREIGDHPCHIEYFELVLKANPDLKIDTVLQIGSRFVSKALQKWIEKQTLKEFFLVTDHPFRQDPMHKVSRKMECRSDIFCKSLLNFITPKKNDWISSWKSASLAVKNCLQDHFLHDSDFSEPFLFAFLSKHYSSFPLYLSSSMPVRDADLLFYPEDGSSSILCNRGASGIDGNIATAAGAAIGLQKPLVAVLGDLAALHDLNSFALIHKSKVPIIIILINNRGGGIFSFLPVSEKKEHFEEFIATSHDYGFASIAETFSLPYTKVDSLDMWSEAWENALASNKTCLIEYCTQRHTNVNHHQNIYDKVSKSLCSFMKPSGVHH